MDYALGNKSCVYPNGYGFSRKLCKSISYWFLRRFLPRHRIHVEVNHRGLNREDAFGFCDFVGDPYRPRDFLIEINTHIEKDFNREMYIRTLIHEFIHLKQWVRGTLKYKSGKLHFNDDSVAKYDYMDQPHEIEAYGLEEELYLDFIYDTEGHWLGDE